MADIKEDNMEVPGVEVRIIGEPKGKGLFAVKSFKTGDVIFEERPLVCCQFAWNAAYGYLACGFCLRPLEGAEENACRLTGKKNLVLPYPQCCTRKAEKHTECSLCGVKYCSTECRDEAWRQYHQTLCVQSRSSDGVHPLELLNEAWKHMHYPPETASIMLMARMLATVKQAQDKEGALHLFMQFCHQTVNEEEEIAHKLLGEQFIGQLQVLRELMAEALSDSSVAHWLTPEGFRSLVALVGTNAQGVGTSSLSEWVKNTSALDLPKEEKQKLEKFIDQLYEDLEEEAGGFLNNEGSALYALQSSCNHSCEPNAIPNFPYSNYQLVMCATRDIAAEAGGFLNNEGSALYALQSSCNHSCEPNAIPNFPYSNYQLVMCATRDIAAGVEICVSYLDECVLERSRHSRHKILRENYLFTCRCSKCEAQSQDVDLTSEEETSEEESDESKGDR